MNKIKIAPFFVFLFIVLFIPRIPTLITDWLFFQETGYTQLFTNTIFAQAVTFVIFFLSTLIVLWTTILAATRRDPDELIRLPQELIGVAYEFTKRAAKKFALIAAFVFSVLIGGVMSNFWYSFLEFQNAVLFKQQDPLFKQDISLYVFKLPAIQIVLNYVEFMLVIIMGLVILLTLLKGNSLRSHLLNMWSILKGKNTEFRTAVGIVVCLFFVVLSLQTYLNLYDLLFKSNTVYGASFTDTTVFIPITYILIGLSVLCAVATVPYIMGGKMIPFILCFTFLVIVNIVRIIIPPIVQRLVVAPNELVKETPFIKNNISATNRAYGLENMEEVLLSNVGQINATDLTNNNLTIRNVRLWDREPLLSTLSQLQEIRSYYEFVSVDNDRYIINGEQRQLMLSARELSSSSLQNKSWLNEKLTFTHGYGVAASPVNQVTPQGLPVLFIKDLPPQTTTPELKLDRPELYYGELTKDYVIANTKTKEFNYPKGEENVYASYGGSGGVKIDSFWKKLLYALRFRSTELLLSDDITPQSRIMYNRQIVERVQKLLPLLDYDNDPYLVIADKKFYWILDGYTMTNRYPYSQPVNFKGTEANYVRNSVKVTVDAYNGTVQFYVSDENDPMIKVLSAVFPNTFKGLNTLPQSLKDHLRYPQDFFNVQAQLFATYHMKNPQIFYNKEDQWEIPTITDTSPESNDSQGSVVGPRHMIMKLPNEKKEEYVLMQPYTPRGKDNLSAWIAARNDGDNYGKIVVYRYPKDSLIYGPKQVIGRINQESTIAQQISLWDQRGSQVIQGPLLVIPIERSLVYVRPLYLKAENGKIPELKRVIVAYEDKIAMSESLDGALQSIFKGTTPSATESPAITPKQIPKNDLTRQANDLYNAAIQAQKEGNWTRYGEQIKKLGEILSQLDK